jgi:hypothetical protein
VAFFIERKSRMSELQTNFEKQWQDGVQAVGLAFTALPQPALQRLQALCALLMEQKRELQAIAAHVDPASHCAGCGGACCVAGKYHFTPVDLLVYLVNEEPLFAPLFGNGLCPFLAETACLMAPAYRPFNCITFNCELIEDLLLPQEVSRFYRLERELRRNYGEIRSLFPGNSMDGALLKGTL